MEKSSNLRLIAFVGVDLRDFDLTSANLEGSNLEGVDLRDTYLWGVYLDDVFFCRTTMPDNSINNQDC